MRLVFTPTAEAQLLQQLAYGISSGTVKLSPKRPSPVSSSF
jgi:hypothetical protein